MSVLTTQEKLIIKFLSGAILLGGIIGIIRHKFISDNELVEAVATQNEKFLHLSTLPVDSVGSSDTDFLVEGESDLIDSLININTATKEELMELPKIGPVTAERILRYREDFGNFHNIDELKNIKGIGPKTMEQLRLLVTL